jgi:hypothetical protein
MPQLEQTAAARRVTGTAAELKQPDAELLRIGTAAKQVRMAEQDESTTAVEAERTAAAQLVWLAGTGAELEQTRVKPAEQGEQGSRIAEEKGLVQQELAKTCAAACGLEKDARHM